MKTEETRGIRRPAWERPVQLRKECNNTGVFRDFSGPAQKKRKLVSGKKDEYNENILKHNGRQLYSGPTVQSGSSLSKAVFRKNTKPA